MQVCVHGITLKTSLPWLINSPVLLSLQLENEGLNVIPVWCKSLSVWWSQVPAKIIITFIQYCNTLEYINYLLVYLQSIIPSSSSNWKYRWKISSLHISTTETVEILLKTVEEFPDGSMEGLRVEHTNTAAVVVVIPNHRRMSLPHRVVGLTLTVAVGSDV